MYKAARISLMKVKEPQSETMSSASSFYDKCKDMKDLAQEAMHVFTLNQQHQILDRYLVSLGTATEALIHPREVFRPAIMDGAAAIVMVHNHPGGSPEPSREDLALLRRFKEASDLIGIRLLDFIVVGRNSYWSAVDEGRI